ncbi:uncharacterized protein LOC126034995 [Accipiter gentilis]|uniref:uncharacterized protein LOC126034995 n=1 Tax=Astur gentilis TaxID=8957 RepID=UPI00210F8B47|nr:uncharacterized protein LOC126034995 [Accipiter gentilis]
MEPLWALLAALALVPICPGPAAEPCPTITAYIHQDNQVTIPINFTGKTFHLQKRNGTSWENFALCLGSRCHKTSSATAGVRLWDGKLELSEASAGTYRAQGSLDNACLVHIVLHEPTPSPLLTHATSPEPAEPTDWLRLSYPISIAAGIIVAVIIVFSLCLYTCGSWHSWQRLNCVRCCIQKGEENWNSQSRSLSQGKASTCSSFSQLLSSPD